VSDEHCHRPPFSKAECPPRPATGGRRATYLSVGLRVRNDSSGIGLDRRDDRDPIVEAIDCPQPGCHLPGHPQDGLPKFDRRDLTPDLDRCRRAPPEREPYGSLRRPKPSIVGRGATRPRSVPEGAQPPHGAGRAHGRPPPLLPPEPRVPRGPGAGRPPRTGRSRLRQFQAMKRSPHESGAGGLADLL